MSEKKDSTEPQTESDVDRARVSIEYQVALYDKRGHYMENLDMKAQVEAKACAAYDILRHLSGLMMLISFISEDKAMRESSNLFLALTNLGELGSLIADDGVVVIDGLKEAHKIALNSRDDLITNLREHIKRELDSILRGDNPNEPIN